jgi:hypothetical protein
VRNWGLVLLFVGFGCLLVLPIWFHATDFAAFSQTYDSLPQQAMFTRAEVLGRLETLFHRVEHEPIWLLVPAFMMLAGGLMSRKRP